MRLRFLPLLVLLLPAVLPASAWANQCQGPPNSSNSCEPDLRLPADDLNPPYDGVTTGYISFGGGSGYPAYGFTGHYTANDPGRFGNAFTFDGSDNDGLSYTPGSQDDHDRLTPPQVTIAAWVKATAPGSNRIIVDRGEGSSGAFGGWGLATGPNGGLEFYAATSVRLFPTKIATPELPAARIWDGNWHAVAGVFDGSRRIVSLWVDGRQLEATDFSYETTSTDIDYAQLAEHDAVYVARGSDEDRTDGIKRGFAGSIDEVELFHKPLTATQIGTLQDAGATTPPDVPYTIDVQGPTLSGTPKVGQSLTCTDRDNIQNPTFTWERAPRATTLENDPNWFPISGASGTHYTVQHDDAGSRVRCHEYGTLAQNSVDFAVDRASTSIRTDTDVPVNTSPPRITGRPVAGNTLTCSPGTWDNGPDPSDYLYQWLKNGVPVQTGGVAPGVEGDQYALKHTYAGATLVNAKGDGGNSITCRVYAKNDIGYGAGANSPDVEHVVDDVPYRLVSPSVSISRPTADDFDPAHATATCHVGSFRDDFARLELPGYRYEYQWYRVFAKPARQDPIADATSAEYRPRAEDFGREIRCRVTVPNVAGSVQVFSQPVSVRLPDGPVDSTTFREPGRNGADPTSLLALNNSYAKPIEQDTVDHLHAGIEQARTDCTKGVDLPKGAKIPGNAPDPSSVPLTPSGSPLDPVLRCQILLHAGGNQIIVGYDSGVRYRKPGCVPTVAGTENLQGEVIHPLCPSLGIEIPAINPTHPPTGGDLGKLADVQPKLVIWDLDGDGTADAICRARPPCCARSSGRGSARPRGHHHERDGDDRRLPLRPGQLRQLRALPGAAWRAPAGSGARVLDVVRPAARPGAGAVLDERRLRAGPPRRQPLSRRRPCARPERLRGSARRAAVRPAQGVHARRLRGRAEERERRHPNGVGQTPTGRRHLGALALLLAPERRHGRQRGGRGHEREHPGGALRAEHARRLRHARPPARRRRGRLRREEGLLRRPAGARHPHPGRPQRGHPEPAPQDGRAARAERREERAPGPEGDGARRPRRREPPRPADEHRRHPSRQRGCARPDAQRRPEERERRAAGDEPRRRPERAQGRGRQGEGRGEAAGRRSAEEARPRAVQALRRREGPRQRRRHRDARGRRDSAGARDRPGPRRRPQDPHEDPRGRERAPGAARPRARADERLPGLAAPEGPLPQLRLEHGSPRPRGDPVPAERRRDHREEVPARARREVPGARRRLQGHAGDPRGAGGLPQHARRRARPAEADPRRHAGVVAGPSAKTCALADFDGSAHVFFGSPYSIDGALDVSLICVPLVHINVHVDGTGLIELNAGASLNVGPLYASATFGGAVFLGAHPVAWQVTADGSGGIRDLLSGEVHAVLSNAGIAGCGRIKIEVPLLGAFVSLFSSHKKHVEIDLAGGASLDFINDLPPLSLSGLVDNLHLFTGCDISRYRTVTHAIAPRGVSTGGYAFTVPRNAGASLFSLEGAGATPLVKLRSPTGRVFDLTGAAKGESFGHAAWGKIVPSEDRTVIVVGDPAAGTWTAQTASGAPAVIRVRQAAILPKPKVAAHVSGHGIHRTLRYRVQPLEGQVVRLFESVRGGQHLLKSVHTGGHGSLRFTVTEGNSTRRRIVAQVTQDGAPRANLTVARFRARSPRVGRVPRIRVRRRGRTALITWGHAVLAHSYLVTARYGDGTNIPLSPRPGVRRVRAKGLGRGVGLVVTVRAMSPDQRLGPASTASLHGNMHVGRVRYLPVHHKKKHKKTKKKKHRSKAKKRKRH